MREYCKPPTASTHRAAGTVLCLALLLGHSAHAGDAEQPATAAGPIAFHIKPQSLDKVLVEFSVASGLQVVADGQLTAGVRSPGVSGNYSAQQALAKLLTGTGLEIRSSHHRTITLKKATAAESQSTANALPKVTVTGKAGYEANDPYNPSYTRPNASTATKTDTPIMETPVSVQVVPQQVLRDQQAVRLEDALKNVSGVVTGYGFGLLEDTFIIRGFENSTNSWNLSEVYRDGALVVEGLFSLADVDRVEILKGPAAMLYGRLQPGGLINVVTKRPRTEAGYYLEQQFGSFDTYRTTAGATGSLTSDGSLSYRVDFEYLDQDSFRDFAFNRQSFVSPKLSWRIGERTRIDAEYVFFNQDSVSDWGLPVIGKRVARIPQTRFLQEPTDRYSNDFQGGGLTVTHEFNDDWKVQGKFFKYAEIYGGTEVSPRSLNEATGIMTRSLYGNSKHDFDSIFGMINLTGKFSTWALDHTLLLGWDYFDSGFVETGVNLGAADGVAPIDIFNPVYGQGVRSANGLANNRDYAINDDWYGFYLQDQIRFGEQWHLLAGFRYDDASSDQSFEADRSDFAEDKDSEFSPRAGLLYRPVSWLSVYGSYVEGYHHANIGRTTDGTNLEPERSRQYEAGLKGEWWDGKLTSTLTYYHLTKENAQVPVADPTLAQQGFVDQAGEARSRGVELDVSGQITEDWRLIASYAYTDAQISQDRGFDSEGNVTNGNKGNRLRNVPKHSGSFWVQHEFNELGFPGLTGGVGVFLASEREGDPANSFQLPGYARVDASLGYARKVGTSKLSLQFNVQNLLDEEYFVAARNRTSVTPARPLAFLGSVRLEF